jgi:hypothetical protein
LRANGSRECAPDDRLREAIQGRKQGLDCFVASLLALTEAAELQGNRDASSASASLLKVRRLPISLPHAISIKTGVE